MSNAKFGFITAIMFAMAPSAEASSPAAWAELYAKASAACIRDAGLTVAKVRGETVDFQASVLMIVDGRHPNGTRGTTYCLYDKVSAKTEVSAAQITQAASVQKPGPATGRTCWNGSFGAQLKTPRPLGTRCVAKNDEGDDYSGIVRR